LFLVPTPVQIPEEIFPDPELERDVFEQTTHPDNQDVFELLRTINPDGPLNLPNEQRSPVPDSLLTKLIKSKLPIASIAIIVYICFAINKEFLLGSSVFSTLILWELFELIFHRSSFSNQSKAGLSLILVLGGIPQRTSQMLLNALGIFTKVLKDVAIFIFFFTIVHLMWSYFVLEENLSEILDKDFNEYIKDEL
jgi:hypothetical protein